MSIWVVAYTDPIFQDEYYTSEIVLEKAFLTKEAAETWIYQQEYWWKYKAHELPVQE